MPRISAAPEGTKLRARAASALDGTTGAWGDSQLLCVDFNASGEIIAASAVGDAKGVIWVKESTYEDSPSPNDAVGGKVYTVFKGLVEIQEMAGLTDPALSAGDDVYASTSGDVTTSPATGAVFIGRVLPDDTVRGGSGLKLVLDVHGEPVSP